MRRLMLIGSALLSAGCAPETAPPTNDVAGGSNVSTSGKSQVALAEVPAAVVEAARSEMPGFTAIEAEAETRDGRRYFDLGGTLPDGSEVEFDVMEEEGRWSVVETQRDISFSAAPAAVRKMSADRDPAFAPTRVIESRQKGGLTIYELYGPAKGDPQGMKVEVKWDGREAEILQSEWAH